MTTSAQLPLCVYCGTARPGDQSRCRTCGRTWIDIRVGDTARIPVSAVVATAAAAEASVFGSGDGGSIAVAAPPAEDTVVDLTGGDTTGEFDRIDAFDEDWDPWDDTGRDKPIRWLVPVLLAAAVVIVYGLIFFGFLDGPAASPTTTLAATPTTEAPSTTAAPTTTQAPVTTTTAAPTTTTTTLAPASFFTPADEVIPLDQLTMRASSIGPIAFGTDASQAAGLLLASLGRVDDSGTAANELGLCPGEPGFFLRWGELFAVFSGTPEDGTFVSYRYAVPDGPATQHIDLQTASGLRVGDSIADLESTYAAYSLSYDVIDGRDFFSLSDAEGLLLWGPVSSVEPTGRVEGIFSPDACSA